MGFAIIIKSLLESKNLTQADVCRMTGIPTSLMSNYIKGSKSPTLTNAIKLAQALNVSLDELAGININVEGDVSLAKAQRIAVAYEKADPSIQSAIRKLLDVPEGSTEQLKEQIKSAGFTVPKDFDKIAEQANAMAARLNQNIPVKK